MSIYEICIVVLCVAGIVFIYIWHDKAIKALRREYRSNIGLLQRRVSEVDKNKNISELRDQIVKFRDQIREICPHTGEMKFEGGWKPFADYRDRFIAYTKTCAICGKVLKTYTESGEEYFRDKSEYESKMRYEGLNKKKAEIDAELAKTQKGDKKGQPAK